LVNFGGEFGRNEEVISEEEEDREGGRGERRE